MTVVGEERNGSPLPVLPSKEAGMSLTWQGCYRDRSPKGHMAVEASVRHTGRAIQEDEHGLS